LFQLSLNSVGQSKIISTLQADINATLHTSQSHRTLFVRTKHAANGSGIDKLNTNFRPNTSFYTSYRLR